MSLAHSRQIRVYISFHMTAAANGFPFRGSVDRGNTKTEVLPSTIPRLLKTICEPAIGARLMILLR
jgi:hypothetical protein